MCNQGHHGRPRPGRPPAPRPGRRPGAPARRRGVATAFLFVFVRPGAPRRRAPGGPAGAWLARPWSRHGMLPLVIKSGKLCILS